MANLECQEHFKGGHYKQQEIYLMVYSICSGGIIPYL